MTLKNEFEPGTPYLYTGPDIAGLAAWITCTPLFENGDRVLVVGQKDNRVVISTPDGVDTAKVPQDYLEPIPSAVA